jgi:enterochelin esterase-like enzyme
VQTEVSADRRITARLRAPDAQKVLFKSDYSAELWAGVPMVKGADGVWTLTTEPMNPGVWSAGFVVDGVPTFDPSIRERDLTLPSTIYSLVDVGTDATPWVQKAKVPHGAVSIVNYWSKSLNMARRMHIYTPPGYETSGKRYPVLYLIHGGGQDDAAWYSGGRAGFILDNAIAERRAKPMIVVMPADTVRTIPAGQTLPDLAGPSLKGNAFAQDMFGDIMPYVETNYRTIANPDNRAIAGLSAGGLSTLDIGFAHQDKFRYMGSFSSGWFNDAAAVYDKANPAAFTPATNQRLKVLWFGAGSVDAAKPNTEALLKVLDRKGVKYTYWPTDGGHAWVNWRRYLNAFAPLLFR